MRGLGANFISGAPITEGPFAAAQRGNRNRALTAGIELDNQGKQADLDYLPTERKMAAETHDSQQKMRGAQTASMENSVNKDMYAATVNVGKKAAKTYAYVLDRTGNPDAAQAAAQSVEDEGFSDLRGQFGDALQIEQDGEFDFVEDVGLLLSDDDMSSILTPEEKDQFTTMMEQLKLDQARLNLEQTRAATDASRALAEERRAGAAAKDAGQEVTYREAVSGLSLVPNSRGPNSPDDTRFRKLQERVSGIQYVLTQVPSIRDAIEHGVGPGNMMQRTLGNIGNAATLGAWSTFEDEREAKKTILRGNQAIKAGFVNSDRFPVHEQKLVEQFLTDPSNAGTNVELEMLNLAKMEHLVSQFFENYVAELEGRDPVILDRPPIGTKLDPLPWTGDYSFAEVKDMGERGEIPPTMQSVPPGTTFLFPNGQTVTTK